MKPECTLEVKEIAKGILHVSAKTQYELASTFLRVQEYYESPYGQIRGQYFTHEKYMDICAYGEKRSASDEIVFSYLEDWNGFNVPGNVFEEWASLFTEHYLWDKEKKLIELVYEAQNTPTFYVIGTHDEGHKGDFDHELSHAWYYLSKDYKEKMTKLANQLSKTARAQLKDNLMNDGYTAEVVDDEIIAYLTTNSMTETADMFGKVRIPWTKIYKLQEAFKKYKEKHFDNDS